jgi:hypothetical protein
MSSESWLLSNASCHVSATHKSRLWLSLSTLTCLALSLSGTASLSQGGNVVKTFIKDKWRASFHQINKILSLSFYLLPSISFHSVSFRFIYICFLLVFLSCSRLARSSLSACSLFSFQFRILFLFPFCQSSNSVMSPYLCSSHVMSYFNFFVSVGSTNNNLIGIQYHSAIYL